MIAGDEMETKSLTLMNQNLVAWLPISNHQQRPKTVSDTELTSSLRIHYYTVGEPIEAVPELVQTGKLDYKTQVQFQGKYN